MNSQHKRDYSRDWSREVLPYGGGNPVAKPETTFAPRDLLIIVFRYKLLILTTFLTAALATLLALWMRDPSYETETRILIKYGRDAAGNPRASLSQGGSARIAQMSRPDINSEAEMFKSYWLAAKVVDELHLDVKRPKPVPQEWAPWLKYELKRAAGWFSDLSEQIQIRLALKEEVSRRDRAIVEVLENLTAEGVKDSSIVNLKLTTKFREGAGHILNRLADHYREHRMSIERSPGVGQFFAKQAADSNAQLKKAESALTKLKEKAEISSLQDQLALTARSVAESEMAQRDTGSHLAEAQAQVDLLEKQVKAENPRVTLEEVAGRNELLDTLLVRKSDLEIERQKLAVKVNDSDPRLADFDTQIANLGKLIAKADTEVGRSRTTGENSVYVDLRKQLAAALRFRDATKARYQSQSGTVANLRKRLKELQSLETSYAQLSREVEMYGENYRLHQRNAVESESAEALNAAGITSISLLDEAVDPVTPVGVRRVYIFGGALVGGLLLGFGLALLAEAMSRTVNRPEQIPQHFGAPLLGRISYWGRRRLDLPPGAGEMEEALSLGSRVDHGLRERKGRVLVVLGANPAAGNSTASALLSYGLAAHAKMRVLLVSLEYGEGPASGEELTNDVRHETVFLPESTDLHGLSLASLVGGANEFGRVVVDVSSAFPRHKQFDLAAIADAVLVTVEFERTPREVLAWLKSELDRLQVLVLGAIINKQRYYLPEFVYKWL